MKKLTIFFLLVIFTTSSFAQGIALPFEQCGGANWSGPTQCITGNYCSVANNWFSQCLPCINGNCDLDPDANTDPNVGGGKYARETLTGQKLVVTSVTGSAAINAGIKIGQILSLDTSAAIKAAITANLKNCYSVRCYSGGKCFCSSVEWTICLTTGCPSAGTQTCGG